MTHHTQHFSQREEKYLGRPHAGREHWERLVIAKAAWVDLARASASRYSADATVIDEWRQRRRVNGWRIIDGWR